MTFIEQLSGTEQEVARRCLAYLVDSRALEGEFETRLGVTRDEAAAVLIRWPAVDDGAEDGPTCLAVSNALNEVAHGVALSPEDRRRFGVEPTQAGAVLARYGQLRGWPSTGVR